MIFFSQRNCFFFSSNFLCNKFGLNFFSTALELLFFAEYFWRNGSTMLGKTQGCHRERVYNNNTGKIHRLASAAYSAQTQREPYSPVFTEKIHLCKSNLLIVRLINSHAYCGRTYDEWSAILTISLTVAACARGQYDHVYGVVARA